MNVSTREMHSRVGRSRAEQSRAGTLQGIAQTVCTQSTALAWPDRLTTKGQAFHLTVVGRTWMNLNMNLDPDA